MILRAAKRARTHSRVARRHFSSHSGIRVSDMPGPHNISDPTFQRQVELAHQRGITFASLLLLCLIPPSCTFEDDQPKLSQILQDRFGDMCLMRSNLRDTVCVFNPVLAQQILEGEGDLPHSRCFHPQPAGFVAEHLLIMRQFRGDVALQAIFTAQRLSRCAVVRRRALEARASRCRGAPSHAHAHACTRNLSTVPLHRLHMRRLSNTSRSLTEWPLTRPQRQQ